MRKRHSEPTSPREPAHSASADDSAACNNAWLRVGLIFCSARPRTHSLSGSVIESTISAGAMASHAVYHSHAHARNPPLRKHRRAESLARAVGEGARLED